MADKITVQPLGKRVLIKPDVVDEKTTGGLYVPPTASEDKKSESGVVVKLGTGELSECNGCNECKYAFPFKEGDKVLFKKYSPEEIVVGEETLLVVDADDILAVVK